MVEKLLREFENRVFQDKTIGKKFMDNYLKKVGSAADMPNKNINLRMHTWKSVGMLPSRGSLWDILESSWMVTLGLGHMSTHLRSKDAHTGKQKSE